MFIGLGDVLVVGKLSRLDSLLLKETVETGNGTFISALHEFDPENNQSGMSIASAHISDHPDFFRSMLVWIGMGTYGTIA